MTGRSVPEWIGKTADTPIPRRVKLRNFAEHGGICHISGRKIGPADEWDSEHVIALVNWNPTPEAPHGNRESNLRPALKAPHKEKTARDIAEKAKVERIRMKHLGIKKSSTFPKRQDPWGKSRTSNTRQINEDMEV